MTNAVTPHNYYDYYTRSPAGPYIREYRCAGREPIEVIESHQPAIELTPEKHPYFALVQFLDASNPFDIDFGDGLSERTFKIADFDIIPAYTNCLIRAQGPHKIRTFALDAKVLGDTYSSCGVDFAGDFGALHTRPFHSLELERLCRITWREAKAGSPLGSLYADAALLQIAAKLYRLAGGQVKADTGIMAPELFRRLEALIDARLGDDLMLADLASEVDLSAYHFSRMFKRTTGMSPHQFVLDRRIAKARDMLRNSGESLAEIAADCGFASQSHMTDVFRAKLGVTPGRYRKEVRS